MKTKWTLLFKLPGGHRYFSSKDGRIALADDSGKTPDDTEDGPLYLDRTRQINIGQFGSIPVLTHNGEQKTVFETAEGTIILAGRYDMTINAGDQVYKCHPFADVL